MSWLVLVLAGLLETVWAVGLESTKGFTRPLPTIGVAIAMIGSMWLLSIATRTLPVSTAYAAWVAIGVLGTAIVGVVALHEPLTWLRALCLVALVASVVGLELTSTAHR